MPLEVVVVVVVVLIFNPQTFYFKLILYLQKISLSFSQLSLMLTSYIITIQIISTRKLIIDTIL